MKPALVLAWVIALILCATTTPEPGSEWVLGLLGIFLTVAVVMAFMWETYKKEFR